jgi:Concanavalin A-like lectin/glucanases superfamily
MYKVLIFVFLILSSMYTLSAQTQGNVIKFDGDGDYVTVPHHAALNISSHWTMEAWIKPDTISNSYKAILSKNRVPRPASLWIRNGFAEVWFSVDNIDGGKLQGRIPFKANEWTHLATTYDSTQLSLFVNGALDTTITLSIVPDVNESAWTFGQRGDDNYFYKGEMDEVRLWNIARNAEQIDYYKDYNLGNDVAGLGKKQEMQITAKYPGHKL